MPKLRDDELVSDHALVRFLERVMGVDTEGYRAVLAAMVRDAAEAGATAIQQDGFIYALPGGRLATVIPAHDASRLRIAGNSQRRFGENSHRFAQGDEF